jgi:tRNA-splicing ligase RtcB
MKDVLRKSGWKVNVFSWCPNIEKGAMEQITNLAQLDFAFHHVAVMPDCHSGFGMPIGGVLATDRVIIPNAVGVDIGCGMCAVKTSLTEIDKDTLKKIMGEIRKQIPVGFNKHEKEQVGMPIIKLKQKDCPVVMREMSNAKKSLGTLGGGNHFIEIQKGSDGYIWIMIHSGSRNLGKQVAEHYNELAEAYCYGAGYVSLVDQELALLPIENKFGQRYLKEMQYCVDFALANRKLMMDRIQNIFVRVLESEGSVYSGMGLGIKFDEIINIAHNYAKQELHFGEFVMVHRKGATFAGSNTIGIIPGSQGSKSYIVRGLGNSDSFTSCSHGAGRKMGRKEAERSLSLDVEIKRLDDLGVIHCVRTEHDLDEAAGAYKDIDEVMENQKDLVEKLVELTPLAVIKG